ncbi:MAG TPA: sensor histidine kinase [Pseudonocardiaceae bacterium]|jgi:signal transduction histidine kinase|nr:sensor histidine kinase [Pseudonocardiaceae bacterium]
MPAAALIASVLAIGLFSTTLSSWGPTSSERVRMSEPMPRNWLDDGSDGRWNRIGNTAPYGLLLILAGFSVAFKYSAPGALLIDLALCLLAAAWMLGMYTLNPVWRERPIPMTVFVAGMVLITALLVVRGPWFGAFTPAAYYFSFRVLRWPWLLLGVGAVAIVAGSAQSNGVDKTTALGVLTYVGVVLVNVAPMCGLAWLAWRGAQRNEERNHTLQALSEANSRLTVSLAENAVLHQQLLDQAREAGVLDERQRMAREIHDTLAQGLTGIITQLQAAEHASAEPAAWQRHITAATGLARESLTEARRSVHALRPEPLRTARLSEALADVANRWSALHGITAQVTTTGTVLPLSPETEIALLRIAQEALTNVAKHARASRVGVTLSYLEHEVALDVRDDGRGFDPDREDQMRLADSAGSRGTDGMSGGFGLVAMRQRIEGLCGTLQVESEPGLGTAISACVPAGAGA